MSRWQVPGFAILLLIAAARSPATAAPERTLVATLEFGVGQAALTDEQRAILDDVARRYPRDQFLYSFEGDHDKLPFLRVTPNASRRVNERLAETRWQNAALYLGVLPYGLVRSTGQRAVRVFVEARSRAASADSLDMLRRQVDELRRRPSEPGVRPVEPGPEAARAVAPPETVLSIARIERLWERSDKWLDRRWYESQLGIELGLMRVTPDRPPDRRRSGAMLRIAGGTPAHQAFEVTTRLDLFRLGVERFGITPALRWYDWSIRLHYGEDREAASTFVNKSDPVYLLGFDIDARPWRRAWLQLEYAGLGARVHAAHRDVTSYDHFDLQFDQGLTRNLRLELQAVYDERFEHSMPYAGGWVAWAWPLKLGEFVISLGYVEELDALAATTGRRREDPISTVSLGFTWRRMRH